jgi:mRNA interferase MazF
MNRGDLVTVALPGAYGKPRPAVVIRADRFSHLGSITFLPFTSDLLPAEIFRIMIDPTAENGLQTPSQVMADKCSTLPLTKVGAVFGRLDDNAMGRIDRALAAFLGFA